MIQTFLSFSHYFLSTQTIAYNLGAHWTNWEQRLEEYLEGLNSEIDSKAAFGEGMIEYFRAREMLTANPNVCRTFDQVIVGWA